jgi:hypothetical protein
MAGEGAAMAMVENSSTELFRNAQLRYSGFSDRWAFRKSFDFLGSAEEDAVAQQKLLWCFA